MPRMADRSRPVLDVARTVLKGGMPPRYQGDWWRRSFDELLAPSLVEGVRILDIGSGREATIPPGERPAGTAYTGLDISEEELRAAEPGSYDELVVGDVARRRPELEGRFDLVVSWQVLEHVKPIDEALENMRSYLRPGGRLVAQLSGAYSFWAIADTVIPEGPKRWLLGKVQGRSASSVFPAHYDRCSYSGLNRLMAPWSQWDVIPAYLGAGYFDFARPVLAAYVAWEEWVRTREHHNLAPYYIISAVR